MYNYLEEMIQDISDVFNDYTWNTEDIDELREQMFDDLWIDDSVTGNGSGSYTFNNALAKEHIDNNGSLLMEAMVDFSVPTEEIAKRIIDEDWEWFDVTIRCYLLNDAIEEYIKRNLK